MTVDSVKSNKGRYVLSKKARDATITRQSSRPSARHYLFSYTRPFLGVKMEYVLTATKDEARAGSYYDKIAAFYDLTFKLNGYGRSLDQYFSNHPLPVS